MKLFALVIAMSFTMGAQAFAACSDSISEKLGCVAQDSSGGRNFAKVNTPGFIGPASFSVTCGGKSYVATVKGSPSGKCTASAEPVTGGSFGPGNAAAVR